MVLPELVSRLKHLLQSSDNLNSDAGGSRKGLVTGLDGIWPVTESATHMGRPR
jgi:hypothetical protein